MNNDLFIPLSELNSWLSRQSIELELIVIGAFAIHLHGLQIRMTMDIDTINSLNDDSVTSQIRKIGEKYGLPNWLNDQAENLILPEGFESRLVKNDQFSNIHLFYASKIDLIKLKVAAYFYRGESDSKDKEDLKILQMKPQDLRDALNFLKDKHQPDTDKFKREFQNRLIDIEVELKDVTKR